MDNGKQEKQFTGVPFKVTNQITKKKSNLELRKNLSKVPIQPQFIFQNEFYKNDTELSKEPWQIKMKNHTPEITWRIIRKCLPYNYNIRKCYLCLNEKLEIALYERENLLNKETALTSKCRHQNKFMLCLMILRTNNDVICKETIVQWNL